MDIENYEKITHDILHRNQISFKYVCGEHGIYSFFCLHYLLFYFGFCMHYIFEIKTPDLNKNATCAL